MGPLLTVALRWVVVGVAMGIGVEIGKWAFNKANEDGAITKRLDEAAEDTRYTWTGRPPAKKEKIPEV
jgi:hypothetical protein